MLPARSRLRTGLDDPLGVPGTERLLALTDGVVAIALTLLVLQLQIPTLPKGTDPASGAALRHVLTSSSFTSLLVAYVVSFYVIAQFWLAHHRVYRMVGGHSEGLAWWNFAFLFTITLFPFSSELLGRYPDNPVAVVEFATNLLLASLSTTLVIVVARRQGLLVEGVTSVLTIGVRSRGVFTALVIVVSIAVAVVSPTAAKYVWILLVLTPTAGRLLERGGRRGGDHREVGGAGQPTGSRTAQPAGSPTDPPSGGPNQPTDRG
jgi:uncharacterized membrane protein